MKSKYGGSVTTKSTDSSGIGRFALSPFNINAALFVISKSFQDSQIVAAIFRLAIRLLHFFVSGSMYNSNGLSKYCFALSSRVL